MNHNLCPADAHDRDPGSDPDQPRDDADLLLCSDCRRPLMYCETTADYAHLDGAAECFLVPAWA